MICLVSSRGAVFEFFAPLLLQLGLISTFVNKCLAFSLSHTPVCGKASPTQDNVNTASRSDNKKNDTKPLINWNHVLFARLCKMSGSHFLSQQMHFILTSACFKQMNSFCLSCCYLCFRSICSLRRGNLTSVTRL